MLVKLSSVRMMSEASLATSVPAMPMAKPTSAFFSAGASLVPSPVTATTSLPAERVLSIIPERDKRLLREVRPILASALLTLH